MDVSEVRSPLANKSVNIMRRPTSSKLRPPMAVKRTHNMVEEDSKSSQRVGPRKLHRSTSNQSLSSTNITASLQRQKSCVLPSKSSRTVPKSKTSQPTSAIKTGNPVKASSLPPKPPTSKGVPASKATKKKRPAWDTKGRLEDLEGSLSNYKDTISNLTGSIEAHQNRIGDLESLNQHLETAVAVKSQDTAEASARISQLQKENAELKETVSKKDIDLASLGQENTTLKETIRNLTVDLDNIRMENSALKSTVSKMSIDSMSINSELQATKLNFDRMSQLSTEKSIKIENLQTNLSLCEQKLIEDECTRRQLHNTIQELKGNIRVFCRIRPLLSSECSAGADEVVFNYAVDERQLSLGAGPTETITGVKKDQTSYDFNFDKVFQPSQNQSNIFEEVSQLIQSVLDGYNVCIFAYGQTGSGKTFTMEGDLSKMETAGMIPRALEQVFETTQMLKDKGWEYNLEASFIEIYNESLKDLLGSGDPKLKHEIKIVTNTANSHGANDVDVTNIKTVNVTSQEQVTELLRKAYDNRAVAATNCNERSSRSHSVFRLKLTGENKSTGDKCQGTLNLVDLAGSERLDSSGSSGARLKETQSINKSLSNLSTVIMALSNKEQYIPYRNSKLTYLLQNSLGGNSKTLMFVNISPRVDSVQETLCSLRFATKVNQCNIGTAQVKKVKK